MELICGQYHAILCNVQNIMSCLSSDVTYMGHRFIFFVLSQVPIHYDTINYTDVYVLMPKSSLFAYRTIIIYPGGLGQNKVTHITYPYRIMWLSIVPGQRSVPTLRPWQGASRGPPILAECQGRMDICWEFS